MDVLSHLIKEHREVETMLDKLAESEEGPEREATVADLTESLSST